MKKKTTNQNPSKSIKEEEKERRKKNNNNFFCLLKLMMITLKANLKDIRTSLRTNWTNRRTISEATGHFAQGTEEKGQG